MPKIKIDGFQLFCMMVIFMFGSNLLLDIGKSAKQRMDCESLINPFWVFTVFRVYFII
ncbi:hypothetical protein [Peribacillus frigoritolerans]|uniref:hypothetical protein n=1 Tax=Peribacillus frigoritolerans TaxID=450367 RepID=UPI00203FD4BF|nr:hypothetical protein [Peribacillus frigoritolerans]MCM3170284.1 hypothetical protein [Peribacillus frigoritolerans]